MRKMGWGGREDARFPECTSVEKKWRRNRGAVASNFTGLGAMCRVEEGGNERGRRGGLIGGERGVYSCLNHRDLKRGAMAL